MKKIDLLLIKNFLGPLVLTTAIVEFVFVLQFVWKWIDEFVGKELEFIVILEQLGYQSLTFIPIALPVSILLSSIMTFGNMGEHYELVALKASGVSMRKVMTPLVVFVLILSGGAFYMSNNIIPIAQLKARTLLYDIQKKKLTLAIKEGVFYTDIDGMVLKVNGKGEDGHTLYDVIIYDHSAPGGYNTVITAKSGRLEITPDMKNLQIILFDGYMYDESPFNQEDRGNEPLKKISFTENRKYLAQKGFDMERSDEEIFKNRAEMMSIQQVDVMIDSLRNDVKVFDNNLNKFMDEKLSFLNVLGTSDSCKGNVRFDTMRDEAKMNILNYASNKAGFIKDEIDYTQKMVDMRDKNITYCLIEWNRKFVLAVACLVFFFVGAPLGTIIRKGGLGLPVVISCFLFVVYHVVSMSLEKQVKAGLTSVWWGMWLPTLMFLPLGIYLSYIATTDSPLLDIDSWKKLFNRKKKKNNSKASDGK